VEYAKLRDVLLKSGQVIEKPIGFHP
jgi:hypothetical protein